MEIKSGDESKSVEIKAHRIVLAGAIPFFERLFMFNTSPPGLEIPIKIERVDNPAVIKSIIDWAYTGKIVIANDTVQHLLIAADYFGCESIKEAAFDFMKERLSEEYLIDVIQLAKDFSCARLVEAGFEFMKQKMNVGNVIKFYQVAESVSCENLVKTALDYIDRYFFDLINSDSWLKCPVKMVSLILSSSTLHVESEAVVWEGFKKYIRSNGQLKGTFPL